MSNLAYDMGYLEERRYEMLDGVLYAMASPSVKHNDTVDNLTRIFKEYLRGRKCAAIREVQVVFSERDKFIPDLSIICDKEKIREKEVHGAPDMIIEVLSPSTAKRDKGYKKRRYEKNGVKEYWSVDTLNKAIDVFLLVDGKLEFETQYAVYPDFELREMLEKGEEVVYSFSPSLFPEMNIRIADIFE